MLEHLIKLCAVTPYISHPLVVGHRALDRSRPELYSLLRIAGAIFGAISTFTHSQNPLSKPLQPRGTSRRLLKSN